MKNLGLTSLTNTTTLTTHINKYYNSYVAFLKLAMNYVLDMYKKYAEYLEYKQDAFEFSYGNSIKVEFPSLYKQSSKEVEHTNRINSLQLMTSVRGHMLISKDFSRKKIRFKCT